MKTVYEILEELNLENGTNYKLDVLKKHKDNELFKRVLKMAYDKVQYTYSVTMLNVSKFIPEKIDFEVDLEFALSSLESNLCTRDVTGNDALQLVSNLIFNLSIEDAYIIERILDRDLKINLGTTNINKVFPKLITKIPYMRCSLYNDKTSKKINYPSILQLKADGRYVAVTVDNGEVTFTSRSGEETVLNHLKEEFKTFEDGIYVGELLVHGIKNRALANGVINSNDEDKSSVYIQLWDYITLDEYSRGKDKKNKTLYIHRVNKLKCILFEKQVPQTMITLVPTIEVSNLQEALKQTSEWMKQGFEGSILKDFNNIFLDHTSPTQLKLKLEIDLEVRCIGFADGKKGTKRESTFGAMIFETDDGKIKGQCSGFSDKELEDFNSRRDELIGQVFTVKFNDLTQAKGNDYYALSHPRFVEFREKQETNTLDEAFKAVNMAMCLDEDI